MAFEIEKNEIVLTTSGFRKDEESTIDGLEANKDGGAILLKNEEELQEMITFGFKNSEARSWPLVL